MKTLKLLSNSLIFSFLASLLILPANAALQAAGPTDPTDGFPQFYRDSNGIALQKCLADATGFADPFCNLVAAAKGVTIFNASAPIHFPDNYPNEVFYYLATARTLNVGQHGNGRATLSLQLEAAFATLNPKGAVEDGQQVTFLRVNLAPLGDLVPGATYTVTHPFGSFTITADATGAVPRHTRFEDGCFGPPCNFSLLLPAPTTNIGPFFALPNALPGGLALNPNDPAARYLGNGALLALPATIPGKVFKIDGPDIGGPGINTIQTSDWTVAGKLLISGVDLFVDGASSSARTTGVNNFATYTLNVTNNGTGFDTFSFTVHAPPGAIAATSVPSITLGTGKSGSVLLNVMSAAPGDYIVDVTATSLANPAVSTSITTTTTVAGVNPSIAMIKAGEQIQFNSTDPDVQWSENSGTVVGSIDANGLFTASSSGNTIVTATNATGAVGTALVIVGTSRYTSHPLVAGYNTVIIPVQSDPAFTASRLLQLVTAQNLDINGNPTVAGSKVVRWNAESQLFETFDPFAGLIDYTIDPGQAYLVELTAPAANVTIVGTVTGIN